MTDLFGAPLVHSATRPGEGLLNDLGVLATAPGLALVDAAGRDHAQLAEAMRGDARLQATLLAVPSRMGNLIAFNIPQAADIARNLDGTLLVASWVGQRVVSALCGGIGGEGEDGSFKLRGYSAPESCAVRGLMSNACRLELCWECEDAEAAGMVSSCFYKVVCLGDLEYARIKAATQPLKIARDVRSAAVEAAFLSCKPVTAALAAAGVKVPRCFDADLRPCEGDLLASAFALLLEDFSPRDQWRQVALLSPSQTRSALAALARQHATFMPAAITARMRDAASKTSVDGKAPCGDGGPGATLLTEAAAAVWPSGTYWQPDFQPARPRNLKLQTLNLKYRI